MGVLAYNTTYADPKYIFVASSGGTVFSANLAGTNNHDLFTDTAVVNDAIYFSNSNAAYFALSLCNLTFNIGTPLAATSITLVWEYYNSALTQWVTIPNLTDNTNAFQNGGQNEVVWPVPAYQTYLLTINSVNRPFVRCRITAISGLTEGGAITTNTIQTSDGIVRTSTDYTLASPLTCTTLYNWIIANTPIPAKKEASIFTFPCPITFGSSSYMTSTSEIIYIGNGCGLFGANLGHLILGTKVGLYGGLYGSQLYFAYFTGGAPYIATNCEFYASVVSKFIYYDEDNDTSSGSYCSPRWAYYNAISQGCLFYSMGYPMATGEARGCVFTGDEIQTVAIADNENFTGSVHSGALNMFAIYAASQVWRNIYWATSSYIIRKNAAGAGVTVKFINPTPKLPEPGATVAPMVFQGSTWSNGYDLQIYEQWTLNVSVIDVAGNAVVGATVLVEEDTGIIADDSATTDSSGDSGEFVLTARRYYYDVSAGTEKVASEDTINYTLTISAPGYQTYTSELDMSEKKELVITLERTVDVVLAKGQIAINTNPSDSQSDVFI